MAYGQDLDSESGGGLRDSSDVGGGRVRTGQDIDSAPTNGDINAATTTSPQARSALMEDFAEREMLQHVKPENQVRLSPADRGSPVYDTSGKLPSTTTAHDATIQWRYKFYNNHYWYWQPNNTWVIWYRDHWVPFDARTYGQYYPRDNNRGMGGIGRIEAALLDGLSRGECRPGHAQYFTAGKRQRPGHFGWI